MTRRGICGRAVCAAWAVVQQGRAGGLVGWAVGLWSRVCHRADWRLCRRGGLAADRRWCSLWGCRRPRSAWPCGWGGRGSSGRCAGWRETRTRRAGAACPTDCTPGLGPREHPKRLPIRRDRPRPPGWPPGRGAQAGRPRRPAGARVIGGEPETSTPRRLRPQSPQRAAPTMAPTLKPAASKVAWRLPDVMDLLEDLDQQELSQEEIQGRVQTIERTLESFGVPARVVEVNQGPVITQFGDRAGLCDRARRQADQGQGQQDQRPGRRPGPGAGRFSDPHRGPGARARRSWASRCPTKRSRWSRCAG